MSAGCDPRCKWKSAGRPALKHMQEACQFSKLLRARRSDLLHQSFNIAGLALACELGHAPFSIGNRATKIIGRCSGSFGRDQRWPTKMPAFSCLAMALRAIFLIDRIPCKGGGFRTGVIGTCKDAQSTREKESDEKSECLQFRPRSEFRSHRSLDAVHGKREHIVSRASIFINLRTQ